MRHRIGLFLHAVEFGEGVVDFEEHVRGAHAASVFVEGALVQLPGESAGGVGGEDAGLLARHLLVQLPREEGAEAARQQIALAAAPAPTARRRALDLFAQGALNQIKVALAQHHRVDAEGARHAPLVDVLQRLHQALELGRVRCQHQGSRVVLKSQVKGRDKSKIAKAVCTKFLYNS